MTQVNQITPEGSLRHLLSIEGLPRQLITSILDRADQLLTLRADELPRSLRGRTVMNLFFEPSTRTRVSFELAARRLGAEVVSFDVARSSTTKGETLLDTVSTLSAMGSDIYVVRHVDASAVQAICNHVGDQQSVLNAGDGCRAHPTQALLDVLTIRQHKGRFDGLRIVVVGDIRHSRVARSTITALKVLGAEHIKLVGPDQLLPIDSDFEGVTRQSDLDQAIEAADVVIALRLQKERMIEGLVPNATEYFQRYGLTQSRLKRAAEDCIVMHPGPFNREVEISSHVADGSQSVIWQQVENGVAIRMAVLEAVIRTRDN